MQQEDQRDYSDIIDLPHHVSVRHPHMSGVDRAAQFGSFEPLRDYKDSLSEERRLTEDPPELADEDLKKLNEAVRRLVCATRGLPDDETSGHVTAEDDEAAGLKAGIIRHPAVSLTYFLPDEKKAGGSIETVTGHVRTVNEELHYIVFEDGRRFLFRDILKISMEESVRSSRSRGESAP